MRRICSYVIVCLILASTAVYSQDIRAVYFRTTLRLPSAWSAYYTMSVTVISDPSPNVYRPNIKVFLGPGSGNITIPATSSTTVSSRKVTTYSDTVQYNIGGISGPVIYMDTFWVAGIKNISVADKSKIKFFSGNVQFPSDTNRSPEVTNMPIGPSNFTISGNQVLYNPFCQDAEGDSISYELERPIFADSYLPSNATINPITGLLSFSKDSTDQGLYAFTIHITDWRKINGTMGAMSISFLEFAMTTNLTLGINDLSNPSFSLDIFPNPTKNIVTVCSNIKGSKQVTLVDAMGRQLGKIQVTEEQFSMDLSGYSQGIYFLFVKTEKGLVTQKIIRE